MFTQWCHHLFTQWCHHLFTQWCHHLSTQWCHHLFTQCCHRFFFLSYQTRYTNARRRLVPRMMEVHDKSVCGVCSEGKTTPQVKGERQSSTSPESLPGRKSSINVDDESDVDVVGSVGTPENVDFSLHGDIRSSSRSSSRSNSRSSFGSKGRYHDNSGSSDENTLPHSVLNLLKRRCSYHSEEGSHGASESPHTQAERSPPPLRILAPPVLPLANRHTAAEVQVTLTATVSETTSACYSGNMSVAMAAEDTGEWQVYSTDRALHTPKYDNHIQTRSMFLCIFCHFSLNTISDSAAVLDCL